MSLEKVFFSFRLCKSVSAINIIHLASVGVITSDIDGVHVSHAVFLALCFFVLFFLTLGGQYDYAVTGCPAVCNKNCNIIFFRVFYPRTIKTRSLPALHGDDLHGVLSVQFGLGGLRSQWHQKGEMERCIFCV